MPADHLTPDDIDRLLDHGGDSALAGRAEHVRQCASCHAALADAQRLIEALESLDDLAPSAGFADRVMAEVRVFEPWHAALGRTVGPWIPATPVGRIAAGAVVTIAGAVSTAGSLWLLARADMAVLLAEVGLAEVRTHILALGRDLARAIVGPTGIASAADASPQLLGAAVASTIVAAALCLVVLWRLAGRTESRR